MAGSVSNRGIRTYRISIQLHGAIALRILIRSHWYITVAGAVVLATGGFSLILALMAAVLGAVSPLHGPAAFLLRGLSWAAFIVPLYFWAGAAIILLPGFRKDLLFVMLTSIAPFGVLAWIARLAGPAATQPLLGASGNLSTVLPLLLMTLAMVVAILVVRSVLFPHAGAVRIIKTAPRRIEAIQSHFDLDSLAPAASTSMAGPADGADRQNAGLPIIAPLPPLPPLRSIGSASPDVASANQDPGQPETLEQTADQEYPEYPEYPVMSEASGMMQSLATIEVADASRLAAPAASQSGPVEEQPIPVMFGRNGAARSLVLDPSLDPALDPALSEDFWDDDIAEDIEALDDESGTTGIAVRNSMAPRGPLLATVEVAFDGTHAEALRSAGSSVPRQVGPDPALLKPGPPARRSKPLVPYSLPVEGILTTYPDGQYWIIDDKTRRAGDVLKETLAEFNIEAEVTGIRKGPVITMFEILPAPGVRLSKIATLSDNIALRLAASSVRIVAPIPGKHAVGIEVPNERRAIVSFREIVDNESFKSSKMEVPVVLGKDISGDVQVADLTQTPHLLIAGATGSGKSVCVNSIILSILYKRSFNDVKLLLIDPKIVELKLYNGIPHLLTPVITEPKKAFQALQYCICEMERRYSLLDAMGVRDIRSYNRKIVEKVMATEKLPYIVVIIDEFADLMATTGKELESTLARLAAMSRAVGIHLVLATQRPSIDVITGLIKANIPSRIAFMVAGKFDSRIIIDMVGAEKLLGRGDMLYSSATDAFPVRMQGAFVSDDEVERVVAHVKTLGEPNYIDDEIFIDDEEEDEGPSLFDEDEDDPLFEKALEIVLSQGKASASFLQRKLKIGYNRAARIVELMEEKGIVGKAQGSKPRDLVRNPEMGGPRPPNPKARYTPDPDPEDDGTLQSDVTNADTDVETA
jgi:S-DNA-T family DNA segregation ATPase FtsK/SpoIIIE